MGSEEGWGRGTGGVGGGVGSEEGWGRRRGGVGSLSAKDLLEALGLTVRLLLVHC